MGGCVAGWVAIMRHTEMHIEQSVCLQNVTTIAVSAKYLFSLALYKLMKMLSVCVCGHLPVC